MPKSKRPRICGLEDNGRGFDLSILVLALTLAATATLARDCNVVEPDSLQINWTAPCEDGSWLLDPKTGCRLWDWNPAPEDTATWSGSCPRGLKEGAGAVQWFEHGRPIDRFEGVLRARKAEGIRPLLLACRPAVRGLLRCRSAEWTGHRDHRRRVVRRDLASWLSCAQRQAHRRRCSVGHLYRRPLGKTLNEM